MHSYASACLCKRTHNVREKRPIYVKRDPLKTPTYVKIDQFISVQTHVYAYVRIIYVKRDQYMWKETYKRDIYM